jgi:hypothetical protein
MNSKFSFTILATISFHLKRRPLEKQQLWKLHTVLWKKLPPPPPIEIKLWEYCSFMQDGDPSNQVPFFSFKFRPLHKSMKYSGTAGVDFTNILLPAFTLTDPKTAKIQSSRQSFLHFWNLRMLKLFIKCWWNRPLVISWSPKPTFSIPR